MDSNTMMTSDEWTNFFRKSIADALMSLKSEKKDFLVSRARACELLEKDPSTLYRWEKSGYLVPVVRRGRTILYSSKDLERLGVILD